jgi:hypothetical protein
MATQNKSEKILVGIDDTIVELKGADLEAFLKQREADKIEQQRIEIENKAKQDSRESAIKKLAEIAGLTKDELNAIL